MSRVTGRPSRRIDVLRDRGFRGGRIAPHRSMIGLEVSRWLLFDLIVLPLLFSVAVFVLLDPLLEGWRWMLDVVRAPLGLPGVVAARVVEIGPVSVAIPYYTAEAQWPANLDLRSGWILVAALAVPGVLLRGRFTPLAYFLRALAVIQLTAQMWFSLAVPPFTYALSQYVAGLLVCGVVILLLAPVLVSFTYFIFDFQLWQKLLLVSMLLVHLAVFLPLQAIVHAWVLYRGTLLSMPILFLVFGVLLDVFVYVALYGWGMSWRSNSVLDATDRQIPVPPYKAPRMTPPTGMSAIGTPSAGSPRVTGAPPS
ncbi:MAG: hypothetical protein IPP90_08255 [Gemmatimonadaceae bacterium]|nr:hypothetical protein [Gemmatimonadaceae bacterium]